MNGFEPLRRRIIDYTDAGQWSEVYDGPIEGCETEQLKAENAKLRELVDELYPLADYGAMDASELDRAHDLMRELGMHDLMRELGIGAG